MDKHDGLTDWMSQLPLELTTAPLWNLAIPGTHDSMAYCLDTSGDLEPNIPSWWPELEDTFPEVYKYIIKRWASTQALTITQQLDIGIRYFDMRIARLPDDGNRTLCFAHILYTTTTAERTFRQMSKWLAEHPKEVVIISCSNFDSMDDEDHQKFIGQLIQIFSNTLCPHMEAPPTLQDCWDKNYQAILSYTDQKQAANQELLWPGAEYWEANQKTEWDVVNYLNNRLQKQGRDEDKFFVADLNVTPDEDDVQGDPLGELIKWATAARPELMEWVTKQHPGPGKTSINILAMDFVDADFVQTVIKINTVKKTGNELNE